MHCNIRPRCIRHLSRSKLDLTHTRRRSDIANERLPTFEPTDTDYPVIPAPSMRRRNSNDLEELGMEIRRLEEEGDSDDTGVNMVLPQRRTSERVVETRRKVTMTRTSSKRYGTHEGA
ncbi:hypothetical protein JVU11DRAFT_8350 [Chiua virens]|nr:hypothetical protein JVU11DRAFT_8350 [Chiua virens]